ncbi:vacuolar sorting protein 9 (VPS9) domain-containing protein [Hirsutella rhossiliensis]|uniref:Vacuolar sorting protein 9 (VPS9) domain-containing protein n=1 Tax=Hirsutella rhossiliensis TaxID=111463 RepID=A0A9P8SNG6_9HYPO|nr:vacuolar sorting protein 9 (VPS9) domain-containing protein [Hirsutella rhossiliensis]KAH0968374.1 vacuolar sorting protein 9 (VPS9) domain-containing protein [Hirsutella rhossiliensis]
MPPLNPFLAAFFKSSVVAQCTPVQHHILLVPLTDVLLTHRDTENGLPAAEAVATDEFLTSHVLRIPSPDASAAGKDRDALAQNLRDLRGKAKQFSTLNGRSVVIKDSFVYSSKGFKITTQAQILNDATWYPDVFEPRQWLLYFISRPLVGTWDEVKIAPALLIHGIREIRAAEQGGELGAESSESVMPRKKDIRSFHDLLNHFPMIARQMQVGLDRLFLEFTAVFEKPLPPPPARSSSLGLTNGNESRASLPVTENFYAEDDEDVMRAALETAVTAAIDLFQGVDKQQLSLLGATTDLTGPLVEKLIERYVTENVHHLLFPKLSLLKRPEDLELESKIRQMEFIDISQLGIAIDGGSRAKHDLLIQLGPVTEEFKKIACARSPGEMMDTLLSTTKTVSHLTRISKTQGNGEEPTSEKTIMTVNADTLVSLLLYVVIRSQVRNLQARITYVRNFIFVDDVESGEMGYALSTFEAVLAYLVMDSAGLRKASRRNRALWEATKKGNLDDLRNIMEPSTCAIEDADDDDKDGGDMDDGGMRVKFGADQHSSSNMWTLTNGSPRMTSLPATAADRFSHGSGLSHVFPFQAKGDYGADLLPAKRIKRVAMDTRSLSSESEFSFHSRTASIGTIGSALEGDISVERLAQTSDPFGESVLMMAVQNERPASLRYLLALSGYYPLDVILQDMNNEDTTLLSAAIQLGHTQLIDVILDHVVSLATCEQLTHYLFEQDIWGRSVGHYLFHAPYLISRIGRFIPWRQRDKNGQTPLFALCRSYDHADYHNMVETGLRVAQEAQGDGQPLHVDDHVDGKGNTLLHIINDARLAMRILHSCDVEVNATNDKRFTALMVASKYGRYDMVRCLFADPRVDVAARELRGLTAVELAKDDDVRNKIDDLGLFSMPAGRDGRITGVVRAYFVEDGSVRLVLKSAAPTDHDSYTVTTSRRSLAEFERLAHLLAQEHPASWIPPMADTRSPFQLPTKPSRALLRHIQARADWFLRIMLNHPTLSTHEMLWEFFLVPELQLDAMEQRTRLKVETRTEKIKEEYEPVEDVREVEQFANHAKDMVRSVGYSTKSVTRRANGVELASSDLHDSLVLLHRQVAAVEFLPTSHVVALEAYVRAMAPTQSSPQTVLHTALLAMQSTVQALLMSLSRPATLINRIWAAKREADRNENAAGRSSRWPLGLLDETRQRLQDGKELRARKSREEAEYASRELRHTQQTVAAELAGWQDMHEKMGRSAMREFARGMAVQERMRLDGMMRALRRVRGGGVGADKQAAAGAVSGAQGQGG